MSIWTTVKSAQGAVRRITELMEESTETSGSSADSGFVQGDISFRDVTFSYGEKPGPGTSYLYSRRGKNDGAHWVQRGWKNHRFPASGTLLYPGPGNDPDRRQGYFFFSSGGMEAYDRLRSPGSLPFFWDDPGKYPLRCPQACYRPGTLRAIQDSCCEEFISAMPRGLMTRLGENGSGLSGGQRQRLSLARLFLQNPRILLLDEVTANLDPESEYMVELALAVLEKGGPPWSSPTEGLPLKTPIRSSY